MAIMWPRVLPASVRADHRRQAEVKVFDRLSTQLPDRFTVFYSSPWLGTDHLGNELDGECDFLIVHREYGLLAIEVKGGRISFSPEEDQWRSKDRNNHRSKIKDPVNQARRAKHELLKKLKDYRKWSTRRINAAHGVILPDSSVPSGDLGADRPRKIFCDFKQFRDCLPDWINDRMNVGARPTNCSPLGSDGILALEALLAKDFNLSFQIGAALFDDELAFSTLEPVQYQVLTHISGIPRAQIRGAAGTGKTVLAVEEAIRSSAAGRRTLLTCFNRTLGDNLVQKLGDREHLTVGNFHKICRKAAEQAGLVVQGGVSRPVDELPQLLYEAVSARTDLKWDAIIVDEAQDFEEDWWISVEAALNDRAQLRLFFDSNQSLYERDEASIHGLEASPISLNLNLRNTKKIHAGSNEHYSGLETTAVGPEGLDIHWIEARTAEEKAALAYKELRRLLNAESVQSQDIAILLESSEAVADFMELARRGGIETEGANDVNTGAVIVDTTRRFKGLERGAVIFVAPDGGNPKRQELAYVGFTRARSYLTVVAAKQDLSWLKTS